jgi:hypothetical protein
MDRSVHFGGEGSKSKSKLARFSTGKDSDMSLFSLGSSAMHSRNYYKSLYTINVEKELEEWDLPFAAPSKPTGAVIAQTQLPPLSRESSVDEITTDTSFNLTALQKMMRTTKKQNSKKGTEARENLYVEKGSYIDKELMKIKTGEDVISFFAKNGN